MGDSLLADKGNTIIIMATINYHKKWLLSYMTQYICGPPPPTAKIGRKTAMFTKKKKNWYCKRNNIKTHTTLFSSTKLCGLPKILMGDVLQCLGNIFPAAQAVSHRLPTKEAWVQYRFKSCWLCGGQSGNVTGFPRVLRFPLPLMH
jgi:phosphoribosyl-AMP cyclohydrolase